MRHIQKLFSSMQNQLEKSHKVFQLELIAGKNAAVIWGRWRVSLRSHNWQDYNFNQKTSSTWPKFSIGYSPYAVPCLSPENSLILAKCSVSCGHSLGFQKIIAKIVNEEATGNSFRAQFRRDHQCRDRFLNRPKVEQFLSLKEDPPYHDLPYLKMEFFVQ